MDEQLLFDFLAEEVYGHIFQKPQTRNLHALDFLYKQDVFTLHTMLHADSPEETISIGARTLLGALLASLLGTRASLLVARTLLGWRAEETISHLS